MGWASGIDIACAVVEAVKANVRKKAARLAIYELFYEAMKNRDWDTEYESLGIDPVWDALMAKNGFKEDEDD